jgi:putative cell wall-binding protein
LKEIIAEAEQVKSTGDKDAIEEVTKKLEEAIASLEKKSEEDYSELDEALAKVPEDLSSYTEESVDKLKEIISEAEQVKSSGDKEAIVEMAKKLEEAIAALEKKADYSAVDEALKKVPEDLSGYTDKTADALQEVIKGLDFDKSASDQGAVDEMAKKLEEAIAALEKKADYSAVDEALRKVPTDLSYYTEETAKALQEAIDAVVRGLPATEQSKVDKMAEKLEAALKLLDEKPKADYSKVDEALEKVPEDLSGYTEETAKELQEVIDALIKDLPQDRQDEVDEMAKKLEEAIAALEKKADYSSVEEALKKVPTDLSGYTDKTADILQEVIKGLDFDKSASDQAVVDEMAKKLEEAIAALEKKADYSAVEEALKKVPEDLSGYTEESASALEKVIEELDFDKSASDQAAVDEMAKKLEEAIKNLKEKPKSADYSIVEEAIANKPLDLSGYTEETVAALKEAIDAVDYSKSADEQDEVDLMAEKIVAAIKALAPIVEKEETVITRYAGSNRYLTAQAIADGLLNRLTTKLDVIIVASGVNYADALSGSYLSYIKGNAPILLINSANEALVKSYITKNLNIGGTVYILGGTGVVSQAFETSITKLGSFTVKRLAGQNRYITNIEILKEAGIDNSYTGNLLICTGTNYADSLSASAVNLPMLLVSDKLLANQKTYLASIGSKEVVILGGTGAVSASLASSLGKTVKERLAGVNRYETSVMVAETFFGEKANGQAVTNISLAYGLDFPDGLAGGPLSRALNAPLLLVAATNETGYKYAIEYIKDKTLTNCIVFGGTGVISDALVTKVLS